jgi:hypothetical protein
MKWKRNRNETEKGKEKKKAGSEWEKNSTEKHRINLKNVLRQNKKRLKPRSTISFSAFKIDPSQAWDDALNGKRTESKRCRLERNIHSTFSSWRLKRHVDSKKKTKQKNVECIIKYDPNWSCQGCLEEEGKSRMHRRDTHIYISLTIFCFVLLLFGLFVLLLIGIRPFACWARPYVIMKFKF